MVSQSSVLLALAWFVALNAVLSIAVAACVPVLFGRARRGGVLLFVRLAPAGGAALFAMAVFLPAHWRFEPANASEPFGVTLYGLAAVGLLLIGRSLERAVRVARAVRALPSPAEHRPPIEGADRAHEVEGFPGVSLAGVLRPRILIGEAARRALSADELEVAIAHEVAHRAARDNLKRVACYCVTDLLSTCRAARALEDGWHAAAEHAADARAVRGDRARATSLAAALVKVARLDDRARRPGGVPAWSTLHDPPLLESRVRRLLGQRPPSARVACPWRLGVALCASVLAAAGAALASARLVHDTTEWLVRILP